MCTTSASTVRAPDPLPVLAESDLAREELCRFLAGCYYEPGPEFAEERLFESIAAAAKRVHPELAAHAQRLAAAFAAAPLEALLVDYTRLFVGAPQALAKPYASVWLSGQPELMQDSVDALLQMYAQGGFDIDPGFKDLPDHVAVELEFLYLLNHQINRAQADHEGLEALQVLRSSFLEGHLGRWLGGFILAVHDHAQTDFYRELAEFTELFVRLEGQLQGAATRH
jgi:putative dimethyl sulfoxide reductase chaperone